MANIMSKARNLILFFLTLSSFVTLSAQSNEGREFWFSFMEHRDVGQNEMIAMITGGLPLPLDVVHAPPTA